MIIKRKREKKQTKKTTKKNKNPERHMSCEEMKEMKIALNDCLDFYRQRI